MKSDHRQRILAARGLKHESLRKPAVERTAASSREVMKTYNLFRFLIACIKDERNCLAQIDKLMGRMPPLQQECDAVEQIERLVRTHREKLLKAQEKVSVMAEHLHNRLVEEGALKKTLGTSAQPEVAYRPAGDACAACRKPLVSGENFARCNHCNMLFHGKCITPLFKCARCHTDLTDFRSVF